jgi:hypothetical protein
MSRPNSNDPTSLVALKYEKDEDAGSETKMHGCSIK